MLGRSRTIRKFGVCLLIVPCVFRIAEAFTTSLDGIATLPSRSKKLISQQKDPPTVSPLNMRRQGQQEENANPNSFSTYTTDVIDYDIPRGAPLQASAIDNVDTATIPEPSIIDSFIVPVTTASLMITGNTVGAGMLVLPEVIAKPGPMLSFGVMIVTWLMCVTSGLTIAQVAIEEHESSGTEVPSSFKEFAEATLPNAANLVAGTSVFINTLIVAFDIFKAGQVGSSILPSEFSIDGIYLSYMYSGLLLALVSSQSLKNLSQVASLLTVGLFATFAGLLLPGLANVIDATSVLSIPPTLPSEEIGDGLLFMTPVVLSVLIFQHIVPTITRLLDYDRFKVITAIILGSSLPLLMYIAWTVTVLGGGIDISSASESSMGVLLTCFSLITVAGSTLGGSMSLSEEFEILLGSNSKSGEAKQKNIDATFSLPSVAIPIGIALVLAQVFSSNINETLKIAGAFGSPILYGFIPVSMAVVQQRQAKQDENFSLVASDENSNIIPGGMIGLGALTLASTALISTEFAQNF